MPVSRAKNWSIGKPLRIEPSVRTATGRGSRNLFGVKDVYKMYLANEMTEVGFLKGPIENVLRLFDEEYDRRNGIEGIRAKPWLVIKHSGGEWTIALHEKSLMLTVPMEDRGLILSIDLHRIARRVEEGIPKKG